MLSSQELTVTATVEENGVAGGTVPFSLLSFGLGCKRDYWDGPLGLACVLCELRVERGLLRIDLVSFFTRNLLRAYLDCLVPNLNLDVRVCLEVVIPVRIGGSPSLRSENNIAVAVLKIHHRVCPGFPSMSPLVIDK